MKRLLLSLAILLWATAASGQLWSGILAATRATDWTSPGVTGGIPTNRTKSGSTIAAYTGTAATINTALAAAPSGTYVELGAGTFNLSTSIVMQSNVTLRGQGMSTLLNFTAFGNTSFFWGSGQVAVMFQQTDTGMVEVAPALASVPSAKINWTGTNGQAGVYSQGATVVNLASTPTGLAAGDTLVLWQSDDPDASVPNSGYFVSQKTAASNAVSREGSGETLLSGQQQRVRVVSVNGTAVTIPAPGIRLPTGTWVSARSPKAGWIPAASTIRNAGLEYLRIQTTSVTAEKLSVIGLNWAVDSWIKGVGIVPRYTSWHAGGATDYAIYVSDSRNITIRDSWINRMTGGGLFTTTSYGIALKGAFDSLVENNILNEVESPVMILGISSGNVIAYNYERYVSDQQQEGGFQQHQVGSSLNLVEGNSFWKMWGDDFHGSSALQTYYRNHAQDHGFDLNSYHRWHNFVGNVIGATTVYKTLATDSTKYDRFSSFGFRLGYSGPNASSGATDGVASDSGVWTTAMLWGNYATTGGTRWLSAEVPSGDAVFPNPVPASQVLPNSFYKSSRPPFFVINGVGTAVWPPIGPDVSGGTYLAGHANKIPAQLAYEAAGGAIASFTPSAYGAIQSGGTYTTNFPLVENPLSEGGQWIGGKTVGLAWQDVLVNANNRAIGQQDGSGGFDDSTAILAGTWGADQQAQGTVYINNPGGLAEVEIRLRSAISAGVNRGYEILFAWDGDYAQIVRWNGPLGNFTILPITEFNGGAVALSTGDIVKATIAGGTINAYVNDVLYMRATDNTWTDGAPGIGLYNDGSNNANFGFTSFTASDGTGGAPPSAPTNLRVVP